MNSRILIQKIPKHFQPSWATRHIIVASTVFLTLFAFPIFQPSRANAGCCLVSTEEHPPEGGINYAVVNLPIGGGAHCPPGIFTFDECGIIV